MTWMQGHTTITELLAVGHLARISGDAANGAYLLEQGRQRIASAHTIAANDPVGAFFELAYDGVRQAAVALLAQQELRAKLEGGHCHFSNCAANRDAPASSFRGFSSSWQSGFSHPAGKNGNGTVVQVPTMSHTTAADAACTKFLVWLRNCDAMARHVTPWTAG